MSLCTPVRCIICALVLCLASSVLEAKPRRLSDLGTRSALEDARFDVPMQDTKMNDQMQGKRVEFGQWHSNFSSLGGKRSAISTGDRFNSSMVNFPQVERKDAGIAVDAAERKMAPLRNVDQVRDIVIASQFNKMAPRTVQGRALQEMVDEMSLKDINRFQVQRNKTDEGVPVQRAASEQTPTVRAARAAETED